jgi:MSHA biogenesis protein MshO
MNKINRKTKANSQTHSQVNACLKKLSMKQTRGFTLVEMVTVIVLIGILSVGVSGFLKFGTQVYVDVTNRDELISSARFVIERLNREIRSALPNSVRVNNNTAGTMQCLEYTPIVLSTTYLDIPVAPEPERDTFTVIKFIEPKAPVIFNNLSVAVYPLSADVDVYNDNNKIFALDNTVNINKVTDPEWIITLDEKSVFAEDSPTKRLYFIGDAISYCVQNLQITRHSNYTRDSDNIPIETSTNKGVLMANYNRVGTVDGVDYGFPFRVSGATQSRNAIVSTKFDFTRNDETLYFNNEIQVPNVP